MHRRALTLDTWEKLGMKKWLTDWATSELADNPIDGVQNFASSVGAPNFLWYVFTVSFAYYRVQLIMFLLVGLAASAMLASLASR